MTRPASLLATLVLAGLLLFPASLAAQTAQDSALEVFPGVGAIDWQQMIVSATGFGSIPEHALSQVQAYALAERAAMVDARRNLLEVVKGVHIRSQTLVADGIAQDEVVEANLLGVLEQSRLVRSEQLADGSVQVLVAMPLPGVLEQEIRSLPLPGPALTESIPPSAPRPNAQEDPFLPEIAAMYTGLVVDARDLGFVPSLTPELFDRGDLLYPGDSIDQNRAANHGLVRFYRNLDQAQQSDLAGDTPLTIRATALGPGGEGTLLIPEDKALILRHMRERPGNILDDCRVVVVF